jgi:hypothetical protein
MTCSFINVRGHIGTIGNTRTPDVGVKLESQVTRLLLKLGLEPLVGVNLGLGATSKGPKLSVKLGGMNKGTGPEPVVNVSFIQLGFFMRL